MMSRVFTIVKISAIGTLFLCLTVFVFLNSFEIVFNRDLRFVPALQSFLSSRAILEAAGESTPSELLGVSADRIGNFGAPSTLRIPALSSKLPLVPALVSEGSWLARANAGHFLLTTPSSNGNIGNTVMYARSGWRTIVSPENLHVGDIMFLDTDTDWRYVFRVVNRSVLSDGRPYVPSRSPLTTLTLLVEDESQGAVFAYESLFVNIQNIRQ